MFMKIVIIQLLIYCNINGLLIVIVFGDLFWYFFMWGMVWEDGYGKNDFVLIFGIVVFIFCNVDVLICYEEVFVVFKGFQYFGYLEFVVFVEIVKGIVVVGFDVCSIVLNYFFDCGLLGVKVIFDVLDVVYVKYFGIV